MKKFSATLVLLACLASVVNLAGCATEDNSITAAPVLTQIAVTASLPENLDLTGTLTPATETDVAAKAPGRIIALNADTGSRVSAGEILAELDAGTEKAMNASVVASLRQAENSLATLRALYDERIASAEKSLITARASGEKNLDLAETQLNETKINGLASANSVGAQTISLVATQLTTAKNDLANNAKSAATSAAMSSQSVADFLDQLLGVSDVNKNFNDAFENNLGALDTNTKTLAEKALSEHLLANQVFRNDFNAHLLNHTPSAAELDHDLALAEAALDSAKTALEKTSTLLLKSVTSANFPSVSLENYKANVMTLGGNVEQTLLAVKNLRGSDGVASQIAILEQQLAQTQKQVGANTTSVESQITILEKQVAKSKTDVAAQIQSAELGLAMLKKEKDAKVSEAQAMLINLRGQAGITAESLENAFVRAPFSGVVTQKFADAGQVVNPSQPLFHLVDESKFKVVLGVPDNLASAFTLGREATVTLDGLAEKTFTARITKIAPSADSVSKKISVEVTLENSNAQLKMGLFARVAFALADTLGVIIPASALVSRYGENFVYVVEEGKAVSRDVELGARTENSLAITSGINEGEEVIVKGQRYLREGDVVEVNKIN